MAAIIYIPEVISGEVARGRRAIVVWRGIDVIAGQTVDLDGSKVGWPNNTRLTWLTKLASGTIDAVAFLARFRFFDSDGTTLIGDESPAGTLLTGLAIAQVEPTTDPGFDFTQMSPDISVANTAACTIDVWAILTPNNGRGLD